MSQSFVCDVCGCASEGVTPPHKWGYVFRPLTYAVPATESAAAKAQQRKDLCEHCSAALDRVLGELRRRLRKNVDVSNKERNDVVGALLAHGEEHK